MNDICGSVTSNIHLFADDYVIYREIINGDDAKFLQTDLNNIADWYKKWLMELHLNKCKILYVSRTNCKPSTYYLNTVPLESVI